MTMVYQIRERPMIGNKGEVKTYGSNKGYAPGDVADIIREILRKATMWNC